MKDIENQENLLARLQKIEGQVRGIHKMVESQRECKDIINQLTAAKNALNKVGILIAEQSLKDCFMQEFDSSKDLEKSIGKAIKLMLQLKS